MTLKLLTRLSDALKHAWEHRWSQSAINERLARPDGSGNRRFWSSQMRDPAHAQQRRLDRNADDPDDDQGSGTRRRWSTQGINERLDAASRKRRS